MLFLRADHLARVFLDHDRGSRGLLQQLVIERKGFALVLHRLAQDVADVVLVRLEERADRERWMLADDEPIPTGVTLRAAPDPNRFYKGRQRFFFPRMCNWWTATRLREVGCPVSPATVIFASRVMEEARACAAAGRQ